MKNKYLENLNKIEFVLTYACTGRCKHCSEGDHELSGEAIDPDVAADAVRRVADVYDIDTVLTFGGEPLLYVDRVEKIMSCASALNIKKRQVITNGYFTRDEKRMREVAERLCASGVNDLLISVDVFHQETIPLDVVRTFATEAVKCGIPLRLQPAWLVSTYDDNPYNRKTKAILDSFSDMKIPQSEGNVVFPEGNAIKYLSEYFSDTLPENPYRDDPYDVHCLSFEPNGDVLGGNVHERDIIEILNNYAP